MWVSNPILAPMRCWRSPSPVSVGVKTSCPNALSKGDTRFQHQPPCQAPWTSTKFRECSEAGIDIGVLLVIGFGWGNTRTLYDETGHRGRKIADAARNWWQAVRQLRCSSESRISNGSLARLRGSDFAFTQPRS